MATSRALRRRRLLGLSAARQARGQFIARNRVFRLVPFARVGDEPPRAPSGWDESESALCVGGGFAQLRAVRIERGDPRAGDGGSASREDFAVDGAVLNIGKNADRMGLGGVAGEQPHPGGNRRQPEDFVDRAAGIAGGLSQCVARRGVSGSGRTAEEHHRDRRDQALERRVTDERQRGAATIWNSLRIAPGRCIGHGAGSTPSARRQTQTESRSFAAGVEPR